MYYGITGTPGTGKKTIASDVATLLGVPAHSLNELVRRGDKGKGLAADEVDPVDLRKAVLKSFNSPCLLYGHLIPYILTESDVRGVVVLRCDPAVLKQRLAKRGYSPNKVVRNVEAELIGVVSADAAKAFGGRLLAEVDTTDSAPRAVASRTAAILRSGRQASGRFDWLARYGSPGKLKSLLGPEGGESART